MATVATVAADVAPFRFVLVAALAASAATFGKLGVAVAVGLVFAVLRKSA
jgi:hypothetical protein